MANEQAELPEWTQVPFWQFLLLTLVIGFVCWATLISESGWVPVLDSANLVFHEAGHVVFGLLGSTFGLYGGTLGQLLFPLVVSVRYWRRRETLPFSLGVIWLLENLLNIARYLGDAREQVLPLVGGGEHDWTQILGRWGLLQADQTLADSIRFVVILVMLVFWGWFFLMSRRPARHSQPGS